MGRFVELETIDGEAVYVAPDAVQSVGKSSGGGASIIIGAGSWVVRGTVAEVVARLEAGTVARLHPTTQAMLNAMAAASQPGLSQADAHELTSRAIGADDAWVAAGCPDAEAVQS